jgi:hypothetical protein
MMVAFDACAYLSSGGFQTRNKSHGESSVIYMGMFLEKLYPKIIPEKTLIVLDEVDNGFSIRSMTLYNNLISKLIWKYKCEVIVISHNPFLMFQCFAVYDFANKSYEKSSDYIMKQTGFELIEKGKVEFKPKGNPVKEEPKEQPKKKTTKKK